MTTPSKKLVLSADGLTATVTDAELADIVSTVFSSDTTITGSYGLVQRGLLFVGGMAVQNKRRMGSWNPI